MSTAGFPATRLRRLRRTGRLRSLVRETRLDLGDFVMPLFACPGEGVVRELEGLAGIAQRSVDTLVEEAETLVALGVSAVLLFGIPEEKDEEGSDAYGEDASAFYGPVREAAESRPALGDRRGYQVDPANVREALRECELDVREGADALILKPALPYLDVLRAVRERFERPVGAYNVSGEYAMLKAAAQAGWLDERQAALESLTAIKRAGADFIVSYWTKELAEWL